MKWLLVLFREPICVISIEKESTVIGCPGIFNFKPSKSGQVYSPHNRPQRPRGGVEV
jgi:hypothetical protein